MIPRSLIQDLPNAYYGLALLCRMAGHLGAARSVLETLFTRSSHMNEVAGSAIYQEAKELYKEISAALDVQKKTH